MAIAKWINENNECGQIKLPIPSVFIPQIYIFNERIFVKHTTDYSRIIIIDDESSEWIGAGRLPNYISSLNLASHWWRLFISAE